MVSPIRSSVSLPVYATPPLRSFHRLATVDSAMSDPIVNLESKVGELRTAVLSLQHTSTKSLITMEALSTRVAQLAASLDRKPENIIGRFHREIPTCSGQISHKVFNEMPHSGGLVKSFPLHHHLAQHHDSALSDSDACAEALFRLRQTGSLPAYIAEFHRLATRASTVSSDLLLCSFIGGLRWDIRYDLRKHKPETTEEAIALAVEFEQRQLTPQCAASDSEDLIGIDSPPPVVLDPLGGVDNIHFAAAQCPVKAARQMFDELPKPTRDFNLDFSIGYHPKIADKGGGCVDLVVFSNCIGHHKELSGVHSDSTTALARGTYISAHKAVGELQSHPSCDPVALSPLDVVALISFVSPKYTAQFAHNVFAKMPDSSRVGSHRKIDDQDGEFVRTDDCWVDAKETAAPNLADKKFEVDFPSLEKFVQELKCAVESECTAANRKEHSLQLGAEMVNCVIVVDLEHLGVRDKGGGHMGSLYSAAHSNAARLYVDNKIRGKAFQGRSDRISNVYLWFQAISFASAYQRGIIDKGGTPSQYNLPMHKSDGYVSECLNWDMQTEYEMTLNKNSEVEEASNSSAFIPETKLNLVPVDMWGPYVSGEALNVWIVKAISDSLFIERHNQSASKMDIIILVQWYPGHVNWLIGHGVDISLCGKSILDVTQSFTVTDQEAITWGTSGSCFELVHCLILIFKPGRNCCITNLEVGYLRGIIDKSGGTPSVTLEILIPQCHMLDGNLQHELHLRVISDSAIVSTVILSDRYITDGFLPDKSVALVEEAAPKLKMETKGIPSKSIACNTLMKVLCDSNQVEEPGGLFAEMKLKGVKPAAVAFNVLMSTYGEMHPKYYGPFEVLQNIRPVAYRIRLPPGSKIHPVFHVSSLKKHPGATVTLARPLPIVTDEGLVHEAPMSVIARRTYKKGNAAGTQLLMQWQGHSVEEAFWKEYDDFVVEFPDFQF